MTVIGYYRLPANDVTRERKLITHVLYRRKIHGSVMDYYRHNP